jgi:hypothetical protein
MILTTLIYKEEMSHSSLSPGIPFKQAQNPLALSRGNLHLLLLSADRIKHSPLKQSPAEHTEVEVAALVPEVAKEGGDAVRGLRLGEGAEGAEGAVGAGVAGGEDREATEAAQHDDRGGDTCVRRSPALVRHRQP